MVEGCCWYLWWWTFTTKLWRLSGLDDFYHTVVIISAWCFLPNCGDGREGELNALPRLAESRQGKAEWNPQDRHPTTGPAMLALTIVVKL